MKILSSFLMAIIFVLLAFYDISYLYVFLVYSGLVCLIAKQKCNFSYRYLLLFSYQYFALMGILAMISYDYFCGNTFAPYNDDSFYYKNINEILVNGYSLQATAYEYIIAIIISPLFWLNLSTHFSALLINWILGALTVVESLKLANNLFPLRGLKTNIIGMLFILFNSNYMNGVAHLYRDIMMCYFFILSINFAYKHKYVYSFIFALLTGFIRGANGLFSFSFLFLFKWRSFFYCMPKMKIILIGGIGLFLFLISDVVVGYSKYLRSFSGKQNNISLFERIETRKDKFNESNSTAGVLALINSTNPIVKFSAIPIYMVSPIKVSNLFIVEGYKNEGQSTFIVTRLRIECLWEFINVLFYGIFMYYLFYGWYYLFKDKDRLKFMLSILFLLILVLITFISMQYRHKMMFILLFPVLYRAYRYNISLYGKKMKEMPIIIMIVTVVLFYNICI